MEDLQRMINAVSGDRRPNGRQTDRDRGNRNGQREKGTKFIGKFRFTGCWQCGKDGHRRDQCEEWSKVLDKNGLPPKGHKGARDRAYDKWKAEKAALRASKSKTKGTVNELSGDDTEEEDHEESEDDPEAMFFMCVEDGTPWHAAQGASIGSPPIGTSNRFQTFADDGAPDGSDLNVAFENFAHKVSTGPKMSQSQKKKLGRSDPEDIDSIINEFDKDYDIRPSQQVVVRSEADLQSPEVKRIIHALPRNSRAINRLARRCDMEEELAADECWVLADTGASVSALKVKRDCPEYLAYVKETDGSKRGLGASSACGGHLKERGSVKVNMEIDGEKHRINYKDMDVSMPIISIKQSMKSGNNEMVINKHGGRITNLNTGKVVKLYERLGVYFMKAKILPPTDGGPMHEVSLDLKPDLSGFTRRG